MATKLTFYFDYISPNAYLAWKRLPILAETHDLDVELVPVLFTGLLRAHNQNGPAEQPAKRRWMSRNIARKAALLDIPLNPPKHHPYNPLLSLRLSSLPLSKQDQWRLVDSFMTGIWVDGLHASDEGDVRKIMTTAGLDPSPLLNKASSAEAKDRLAQQTQSAIDLGVFGIPSMICDGELFFGYDDFVYLDMMLSGRDPLDTSEQAKAWVEMQTSPSSMRKEMRVE